MQQRFLLQILLLAQHVSGITMPNHQELKSIIQWLLPVAFRAVVLKLLVWCGAEGYVSGLRDVAASGHMTLSSTPDQQLENHSTKYHRQQTVYNSLELLMMGIVVPETC